MFTSSLQPKSQDNLAIKYQGVNLVNHQCHQLQQNHIYSKYSKDELHYVVDAMQKGNKPPTKIGLKRLKRKQWKQKLLHIINPKQITELNPKSPQQICMKALRTQFIKKIQKQHVQQQPVKKQKTIPMMKRRERQKQRRIELITLTEKYRHLLTPHFGERMNGYGRCPKVSRQEIKDYLKTIGINVGGKIANKKPKDNKTKINNKRINKNNAPPARQLKKKKEQKHQQSDQDYD